jgi:16S rRNA G966 N2-methylase RsmD
LVAERVGVAEGGVVVIEHARRRPLPEAFRPWKEKVFGETALAYFRE